MNQPVIARDTSRPKRDDDRKTAPPAERHPVSAAMANTVLNDVAMPAPPPPSAPKYGMDIAK